MFLSVVIPSRNELARLPGYVDNVQRHLDFVVPEQHEIVIINDGSPDGFGDWCRAAVENAPHLAVRHHHFNQGKVAALCTGFAVVFVYRGWSRGTSAS